MSSAMLLGIFDWIGDFFKSLFDLIPKVMYLLYASLACVLDVLQLFFRKLAGLDVYYVDGKAVAGDLVTNFITGILGINPNGFAYSALSTVFWAFIVFGIIMCFMTTIVAIVKSHYSYDDKAAKGPMQYVYTAGKAVVNIIAVPIIVVLGLYLSQGILTALDTITSVSSGSISSIYGDRADLLQKVDTSKTATNLEQKNSANQTYVFYDIFGFGGGIVYGPNVDSPAIPTKKDLALVGSSNQTFSGSLFKVAAYNANRARIGTMNVKTGNFSGAHNDAMTLFANANNQEELANMIDTAFACNLHLLKSEKLNYSFAGENEIASVKYFTNYYARHVSSFSKFNVGLVWYYYDLWSFNFIVGFAGCIVCVTLFINIILGLITRLFMCIGLFLVAPPLFGLAPLDGGKAGKSWQENFMKQVLMAYGAVIGMNIFFLILPYINEISFFNIAIADYFAQVLIIIVGLITIKAFIATVSGLVGGADANETGGKISEEVGQVAGKAASMTLGAAKVGGKVMGTALNAATLGQGKKLANKAGKAIQNSKAGKAVAKLKDKVTGADKLKESTKDLKDLENFSAKNDILKSLDGTDTADFDKDALRIKAEQAGIKGGELNDLLSSAENVAKNGGNFDMGNLQSELAKTDSKYDSQIKAGLDNETRMENAMVKAKAKASAGQKAYDEKTNRRLNRAKKVKSFGSMALTPFTNLDSIMDDSKVYSAFKEKSGIKPKTDWTRRGAEATESLLTETRGGRADMRQGFDNVSGGINTGFRNTNRRLGTTNSSINTGFANMHSDVTAANAALGNIENETRKIKKNTGHISREVDGLKQRSKNVLEENKKARKKQTQTADELKGLKKGIEDINKKL